MLKLDIPPLLEEEFVTVVAVWNSKGKTRRVDSLVLSWVKYEKQLRRLFSYLIYQNKNFTESEITSIIDVFVENKNLYPETFIVAVNQLGVKPISDLVGQKHTELANELQRIKKYRNKLMHGQITGESISSRQLERDVKFIVQWVASLAEGANNEFGYDGLRRNTFKTAKANSKTAVPTFPFSTTEEFSDWLKNVTKKR